MLKFDERTAKILDRAYLGRDFVTRRRANLDALGPCVGEYLADIGCGAGHMTAELGLAVGEGGQALGVDPSGDMRAMAELRCADYSWIRIVEGSASKIPVDDGALDGAVSMQVFEYIDGIPGVLPEVHRALRPGGRLVIGDMEFGSLVWFSDDAARMQRMVDAWDAHFVDPHVPQHLPPMLRDAGFQSVTLEPVTILDTEFRADGLARMMWILMPAFAVGNGLMSKDEAQAWSDEQEVLVAEGRFFFSFTHVVVRAEKR